MAAQGKKAEAIRYAESCRDARSSDFEIDYLCDELEYLGRDRDEQRLPSPSVEEIVSLARRSEIRW